MMLFSQTHPTVFPNSRISRRSRWEKNQKNQKHDRFKSFKSGLWLVFGNFQEKKKRTHKRQTDTNKSFFSSFFLSAGDFLSFLLSFFLPAVRPVCLAR